MTKLVKPGTDNEPKGKYKEVGPRGGEVPKPRVVSIDYHQPKKKVENGKKYNLPSLSTLLLWDFYLPLRKTPYQWKNINLNPWFNI